MAKQFNDKTMLELFSQFGWILNKDQKISSADIYAKQEKDSCYYYMKIDDGNCYNALNDAVYHIYANDMVSGKIFEGIIETPEEFIVVMKVLGFEIINHKS